MHTKIQTLGYLALFALVGAAALIFYFVTRGPYLQVQFHPPGTSARSIGLLRINDEEQALWKQMLVASRQDSKVGATLLENVRDAYGKRGVDIPKINEGAFAAHVTPGKSLVFHLDSEGYGYFEFLELNGDAFVELDHAENGYLLVR